METDSDSSNAINLDDHDGLLTDSDDSEIECSRIRRRPAKSCTSARKKQHASQAHQEPNLKDVDSLGSIKSMELVNFMCHSNFYIELGQNVNFVIGRNGSGKSAILSAIMLVLGAKSSSTARGSNVGKFIKTGESKARVTIVLNNWNGDQEQSFKFSEYGHEIIVERTISPTYSNYAIKSSSKQTIATKSSELREILRFFAIQVENPVVILTQETSRNFLNSKSAKDKYQFFMRATNLAELRVALTSTKNELVQARKTRNEKGKVYDDMVLEAQALEKQVEALHSLDRLKARASQMRTELSWAKVITKEKDMEKQKIIVQSHEEDVESLQTQLEGLSARVEALNKSKDKLQQKSDEMKSQSQKADADYLAVNDDIEKVKREEFAIQGEIRKSVTQLKELDALIRQFRETIEKESNSCPQELEQQSKERKLRMIEVKTEIDSLTDEIKEKSSSLDNMRTNIAASRSKLDDVKYRMSQVNKEISAQEARANTLKNARSADFGAAVWPHSRVVKDRIEEAARKGKFRAKNPVTGQPFVPVGPLAAYITLNDPKCSVAALAALKGLSYAFACDNNEDAKVLRSIIATTNARCPQIIIRKFRPSKFDVEHNKLVDSKCKALVDLMTISDPNVFNVLIDKTSIERIAFIEDPNEATSRLLNQHTVPHKCLHAFDRDGTQYYPTTLNKVFRSYPHTGRTENIFSRDVSGQIRLTEEKIKQLVRERNHIQDEHDIVMSAYKKAESEQKKMDEEIRDLKSRIRDLKSEFSDLEAASQQDKPVELTALQEELDEYLKKKDSVETKLDEYNDKKRELSQQLEELQEKRRQLENDKRSLNRDRSSIGSEIQKISDKIVSARAECDSGKIQNAKARLEVENSRLHNLKSEIDAEIQSIGGERMVPSKRVEDLKAEIKELDVHIASAEKKIGCRDELTKKNTEVQEKLAKITDTCQNLDKCIASLEVSLNQRRKLLYKHREDVCHAMRVQFKRCLNSLNYVGSLTIDHGNSVEDGKLILSVNPKEATNGNDASGDSYKDTRSLSGGERSYSTVAFLLALWEGCNSPFCILDEVDVFMDMITRQIAMDTLVNAAAEKKRQYIFLSPLPLISDHIDKQNIRIHQLKEPVRDDQ